MGLSRLKIWFTLVLAVCLTPSFAFAMKLTLVDDGRVYYANLNGVIEPSTPKTLKPQLERAVKKKPMALFIQSPGGAFDAIQPMADMILNLASLHYETHHQPLMVNFQFICGSGCSILSSLLTKRRDEKTLQIKVADDTDFGFHGSVIRENGVTDKQETLAERGRLEKQIYQTYLDAGVSPEFLQTNSSMFKEHFKQRLFPAKQMCAGKTMVIPPDSCVANQMEIYKWIMRQTATPEQLKVLLPNDHGEKKKIEESPDDEQPDGDSPLHKSELDEPGIYASRKKSMPKPKSVVRTDRARRGRKATSSRSAIASERDDDPVDVAPPED